MRVYWVVTGKLFGYSKYKTFQYKAKKEEQLSNFLFFVTVLKVPLSVDVNNQTFIASMEQKLATAFVMAFERQKQIAEGTYEPLRRRRAAQVQDTVVNVSIFVIICKIDWLQSTYCCGLL